MTKESIILKIKKLMQLSTSGNEHEASSALKKASEMMRDHCISEAQVKAAQNDKPVPDDIGFEDVHFPSNTKTWSKAIAGGIANAFGCKAIFCQDGGHRFNTKWVMRIFGTTADRMLVPVMLDFAYTTINRLVKKEQKRIKAEDPYENIKRYSHNYRVGLTQSMRQTLWSIESKNKREAEEGGQYGIVLFDKNKRAEALVAKLHPHLGKGTALNTRDNGASGGYAGRQDGKKVNFNKPVGMGSKRGQLR